MKPLSFKRHRFPPDVIRRAVWLYFRLSLSLSNVEKRRQPLFKSQASAQRFLTTVPPSATPSTPSNT